MDLAFNYRPIDIGPRQADITNNDYQLLFGAKGKWLDRFDWDTAYTYGYDDVVDLTSNAISESRLRAVLARSTPDALNIFGGPTYKNSPAVLNAVRVQTQKAGNSALDLWDAHMTGDLIDIPTGTVGMAASVEVRMEKFNVANDSLSTTLDDIIGQEHHDRPDGKSDRGVPRGHASPKWSASLTTGTTCRRWPRY